MKKKFFPELVEIPGGTFLMGSPKGEDWRNDDEGPQHEVTIPAFLIGKYPVTQAQYEAVMGTNPATKYDAERFVAPNKPVVGVSWRDAVEYCARLSQLANRPYRLPTESEWEYTCRAGMTTPFQADREITTYLYVYGTTSMTTPVGKFPANDFGLYDMHGNVWEWCQDTWHDSYEGAPTDGSAWIEGGYADRRVIRGGSWACFSGFCRPSIRDRLIADYQGNDTGLRVAVNEVE